MGPEVVGPWTGSALVPKPEKALAIIGNMQIGHGVTILTSVPKLGGCRLDSNTQSPVRPFGIFGNGKKIL